MRIKSTALAAAGLFCAFTPVFSVSEPQWWTAYGVLESGQGGDNWSPVNVGQLKQIAAQAKAYFDTHFPGGAGAALDSLIDSFGPGPHPENFAPANIGQLITVATPFFDRLYAMGFDARESLERNGYSSSWNHPYPWDPATDESELFAPVNVGQLKLVFSFDLSWATLGHGIPDWWQMHFFEELILDAADDPNGIGISIEESWLMGIDPTESNYRLELFSPAS